MLMTYKDNSTFDPAAFLAHADLGRRIIDMKPDQTFLPGDPADSSLSSERPGETHCCFARRQRGQSHASLRRRFRWRRVAFGGAWTAPGHGHRDQRVHGA